MDIIHLGFSAPALLVPRKLSDFCLLKLWHRKSCTFVTLGNCILFCGLSVSGCEETRVHRFHDSCQGWGLEGHHLFRWVHSALKEDNRKWNNRKLRWIQTPMWFLWDEESCLLRHPVYELHLFSLLDATNLRVVQVTRSITRFWDVSSGLLHSF